MLDLHIHSTCSDGADTPESLVAKGALIRLHAMALTDHDTTRGVPAFLAACRQHRLTGLAGVEISLAVPSGTLHLLGYGIDPEHAGLQRALDQVRTGRAERNAQILARLQGLGFALAWPQVAACAGGDVVGRMHFARALVAAGAAPDVQAAFQRYLIRGRPAYVERFRLTPEQGIRLIREAGGLPVAAHPFLWLPDFETLAAGLTALQAAGLGGLEVYYPEHSPEQLVQALRLAQKLGLVATGGTDYHGAMKPGLALGTARGGFCVRDDLLPPLLAALPARSGVAGPFVSSEEAEHA